MKVLQSVNNSKVSKYLLCDLLRMFTFSPDESVESRVLAVSIDNLPKSTHFKTPIRLFFQRSPLVRT